MRISNAPSKSWGPTASCLAPTCSPTWRVEAGDIYKKNLQKVDELKIWAQVTSTILWRTASKLLNIAPAS